MDSSPTLSGRAQILPKQCDHNNSFFLAKKNSPSSSSSSSSLSWMSFSDETPLSPAAALKFSGIPFSWETLPGIPKENIQNKNEFLLKALPPPPTSISPSSNKKPQKTEDFVRSRKKLSQENFNEDPFIAALVECSKDNNGDGDGDDDSQYSSSRSNFFNGGKITRSISDRFGFINMYTSCKKTCAVSESSVYIPRATRTSYDLNHHHYHPRRSR